MYALICKRAYTQADPSDGARILVDRLWPRGIKKEQLAMTRWAKEAAPSTPLRKWWGHDPATFDEFKRRYEEELNASSAAQAFRADVLALLQKQNVTFVYGAKSETCNHAIILRDWVLAGAKQ